jgi:hypothetical protein
VASTSFNFTKEETICNIKKNLTLKNLKCLHADIYRYRLPLNP